MGEGRAGTESDKSCLINILLHLEFIFDVGGNEKITGRCRNKNKKRYTGMNTDVR